MRRPPFLVPSLAAVITTFIAASGLATPISYDESVDGPLPTHFDPSLTGGPSLADLLTLDVGTNVFAGSGTGPGSAATFDTAPVILPAGLSITSISVSVMATQGAVSSLGVAVYFYDAGVTAVTWAFHETVLPPTTDASVFSSDLPLSFTSLPPVSASGRYGIAFSGVVGSSNSTYDYTWKLVVEPSPVPEPVAAILLVTGLAVLAGRGRAA